MTQSNNINWADMRKFADDGTRPLPDGVYALRVESAEATVASTGSSMIKSTLVVTEGPNAGRKLWTNFVISPDSPFALKIFFNNMTAFGVDPTRDAPDGSVDRLADVLRGRTAYGNVTTRMWQGSQRNQVDGFSASPGAGVPSGLPSSGPMAMTPPVDRPGPSAPSTPSSSSAPSPGVPSSVGANAGPAPTSGVPNIPTPPPVPPDASF